jgi:hypothetical protein
MINIHILNIHAMTSRQVQCAHSVEQAQSLIKNVMPKLLPGYSYIIKL